MLLSLFEMVLICPLLNQMGRKFHFRLLREQDGEKAELLGGLALAPAETCHAGTLQVCRGPTALRAQRCIPQRGA